MPPEAQPSGRHPDGKGTGLSERHDEACPAFGSGRPRNEEREEPQPGQTTAVDRGRAGGRPLVS